MILAVLPGLAVWAKSDVQFQTARDAGVQRSSG